GVGVWTTLPADVRAAGSLTVPVRPTTAILATMPEGRIELASVQIPEPAAVAATDLISPLPGGPALQLERCGATGRRQRTRVRLSTSQAAQTMEAVGTSWRKQARALASLEPDALRQAWGPCLLLAKKRDQAAEDTPDMDHALVLLRCEADALVCTATTRQAVAQSRVPWTPLEAPGPISHVLIDERMLRWISNALKQERSPVTLTLVPQAGASAWLLVVCSQGTLVCRVTTAPIPLVWERRVHAPGSQVMLVSRVLFAKALDVLAADRAHGADRCIMLQAQSRQLRLQWNPLAQEDQVACELPIANTVEARAPVLVHLRTLREMLRQINGPVVCLEQGEIRLRTRAEASGNPGAIGFLRLSPPLDRSLAMMMTSAEWGPSPSMAGTSGGPLPERSDAEGQGKALATP
ncbi:MAG TPA: hypothetical protein VHD63_19375, partial [Ktedonobacteraceae bacterium]|nr:hypothetical protein [Ktedonobacteraceae bacterium]